MTPTELRSLCESLNENGTGGQTELANRLGWSDRTMRRKLAGDSTITRGDELAIQCIMRRCSQ